MGDLYFLRQVVEGLLQVGIQLSLCGFWFFVLVARYLPAFLGGLDQQHGLDQTG